MAITTRASSGTQQLTLFQKHNASRPAFSGNTMSCRLTQGLEHDVSPAGALQGRRRLLFCQEQVTVHGPTLFRVTVSHHLALFLNSGTHVVSGKNRVPPTRAFPGHGVTPSRAFPDYADSCCIRKKSRLSDQSFSGARCHTISRFS
jgi:hypothetical protein